MEHARDDQKTQREPAVVSQKVAPSRKPFNASLLRIPLWTTFAYGNQVPPTLRSSTLPSPQLDHEEGAMTPISADEHLEEVAIQRAPTVSDEGEALQTGTPPAHNKQNSSGLPDALKASIERLSGLAMDDVHVHYNSSQPAQVQALAYTQGTEIHIGSGQEQHLAHEAWHVVQQKRGRVSTTEHVHGLPVNDSIALEAEAERMGHVANSMPLTASRAAGNIRQYPSNARPSMYQFVGITLAIAQAAVGSGSYRPTAQGQQISSDDQSMGNGTGVKYHVSILVNQPGNMHISYYPEGDSEYKNKIIHFEYGWNAQTESFGPPAQKLGTWKPYAKKFTSFSGHAGSVIASIQARIKQILEQQRAPTPPITIPSVASANVTPPNTPPGGWPPTPPSTGETPFQMFREPSMKNTHIGWVVPSLPSNSLERKVVQLFALPTVISSGSLEHTIPIQMKRGQVLQDQSDVGIYVYSPEEDMSFGLPPATGLLPGDVIEFDVQNDIAVPASIRKITVPPAAIGRINVADEEVGTFGQYRWNSYWQLDSPSLSGGYIIQNIAWLENHTTLAGQVSNELHQYQEAWRVEPGAGYTQKFIQDTHEWREEVQQIEQNNPGAEDEVEITEPPYDDEIAQDEPIQSSRGFIIIQATTRFYEGLVLPQDFIVDNPDTLAEALPSRTGHNTQDLHATSVTAANAMTLRLDWGADGITTVTRH